MARTVALLSLLCGLSISGGAQAGFCPPGAPQCGGMRDIMLIYQGDKPWTPAEFYPYVAYLDRQGNPQDWFYDAFLFLMYGGAPSGATYIDGKSDRKDWEYFLDVTFAAGRSLDGLDRAIAEMGERMGGASSRDREGRGADPRRVCPIILMIPYPSPEQRAFGDVDGDGVSEDLTREADRVKAVRWYVDEALARWRALAPRHLTLWGFYLMNEGIGGGDEAIGRATAEEVHARGYKLHWIPWFRAPGLEKWRDLGIDFAIVQPNYAFIRPDRGFHLADEDRLTQNANDARRLGLGVEMETPFAFPEDPAARWVFRQYLNHGVAELDGYMHAAVRAYYQGSDVIARCATSDQPHIRVFYDDLYRFHKGTYTRRRTSLAEGVPATVAIAGKPVPTRRLTDGLWLARPGQAGRLVAFPGGRATATLDLGSPTLVDDVRVHLAARTTGELPERLRVSAASGPGKPFRLCGESYHMPSERVGDWVAGFAAVHFVPVVARLIRVELTGAPAATLRLDEVVIPPPAHLLWGAPYRLGGDVVPADVNAWRLTEGMPDDPPVRWRRGPAEVHFQGDAMIGSQVRVRVRKPAPTAVPTLRVRTTAAGPWRSGALSWQSRTHAWLTHRLAPEPFDQLAVRVAAPATSPNSGGPGGASARTAGIALEEIQVVPAPNLARHCPYTLSPDYPAEYPDDGRELTDGRLSEGFGDGRTVGWFGVNPTVTLDLGQLRVLDTVRVHLEGGGYAAVYAPKQMTVFASRDGASWERAGVTTTVARRTGERQVGGERAFMGWMQAGLARRRARFLRLEFAGSAWTMLSEVQVLSGGRNVAAGRSYHLSPAPTSTAQYADRDGFLTDGAYSRGFSGWSGCAGWNEGQPTVTLDLLKPRSVQLVRVHLAGGGPGGVYFPQQIQVELSADGQRWTGPLHITERPAETGTEGVTAFMVARITPATRARYVRLTFVRRGWLMVDEVEVFGLSERAGV